MKSEISEEYSSYADYLEKTYHKKEEDPLDTIGFKSVGVRLAHESLDLLQKLVSGNKIICKQ